MRDRPLKDWIKTVGEDLIGLEIIYDLCNDRVTWRVRIHVVGPANIGNEL